MKTVLFSCIAAICGAVGISGSYDCTDPAQCTVTCDGTNDDSDLNSAIAGVNSGGTILVGSGACSLSSTVTISKPLTLAGAGRTSTTFGGTASPMVTVSHGASGLARVTGIYFNANVVYVIRLSGPISQVRIDNNRCDIADYCIFAVGSVEGVIDNNQFINCDQCFFSSGAGDAAWSVDYSAVSGNFVAGSSHMLFVEDNQFTRNASFSKAGNEIHYTQTGARTVFRYNAVDMSLWTTLTWVYDAHGNGCYYDAGCGLRGPPIHEVYGNTFILDTVNNVITPRGGSNLIYNNSITVAHPAAPSMIIKLVEEEALSGAGQIFTVPGFDYIWPTEDMITNTFIWGNTFNGSALTSSNVNGSSGEKDCCGTYSDSNYVINFNRDVWMHAPESTGGRTYYTDRPGASGRGADGTLLFTQSGANAYYPYTPYTYPHPLRGEAVATKQVKGGGYRKGAGKR